MLKTPQVERKGCLEWLRDPRNRLIYHLRGLLARPSFIKLEKLRIRTKLNHFAIKGKIYIEALKIAYDNLEKMSGTQNRLALV
jgi:hypothetical protein